MLPSQVLPVADDGAPEINLFLSSGGASPKNPRSVTSIDELKGIIQNMSAIPRADQPFAAAPTVSADTEKDDFPLNTLVPIEAEEDPPSDPGFVWIDLLRPSDDDIESLLMWLPVHSITISNVLEWRTADRVEYYPSYGYAFISFISHPEGRSYYSQETSVPLFALVFDSLLITFRDHDYAIAKDAQLTAPEWELWAVLREGSRIGVSTLLSSLIASTFLRLQSRVMEMMIEVDQLDELMLQVMPSEVDHNDLLVRFRQVRHRVASFHVELLEKERFLQQLLLPVMRRSVVCRDPNSTERYQRALTQSHGGIEKLRRARDTVNLSSMNLISGVAARLIQHCHYMDHVNHVQTQIALVVMPVNILPGLFTMNVKVPFQESDTTTAFWTLVGVTLALLFIGLAYPIYLYFHYRPPGALAPI